jgi:hypothetical protein
MKIPPLSALAVSTIVQICLAGLMFGVSWSARATHRRTGDTYATLLQMQESSPAKREAIAFVRLASKEANRAESSFEACALLALGILVMGGVQLLLVVDAVRGRRRTQAIDQNKADT